MLKNEHPLEISHGREDGMVLLKFPFPVLVQDSEFRITRSSGKLGAPWETIASWSYGIGWTLPTSAAVSEEKDRLVLALPKHEDAELFRLEAQLIN